MLKDKPASQGPQITTHYHLAEYNVLAVYNSLDDARNAIESLGRAGIEGKHITLTGDEADHAAAQQNTARADAAVMKRWLRVDSVFAVVGAIIGAAAGLAIGIVVDGGFGGAVVAMFLGALFLGIICALIGVIYPIQAGDTWELTFQESYGNRAIVGVHANKPDEVERARTIFLKTGAAQVRIASSSLSLDDAVAHFAHVTR
jgi:outer membrane lipoprotein SlyB